MLPALAARLHRLCFFLRHGQKILLVHTPASLSPATGEITSPFQALPPSHAFSAYLQHALGSESQEKRKKEKEKRKRKQKRRWKQ